MMVEQITTSIATAIGDLIQNGIIIFAICYILGFSIKNTKSLEKIPNDWIPFICMIVGAVMAAYCTTIFTGDVLVVRIFKGIILGWAPTGLYETLRKWKKDSRV